MKNKMYTTGEIVTIKSNLRAIEEYLGRPIPGGVVDVSELKDHLLRGGEVVTYCHNLKEISSPPRRRTAVSNSLPSETMTEIILFILFIVIGSIVMLFK